MVTINEVEQDMDALGVGNMAEAKVDVQHMAVEDTKAVDTTNNNMAEAVTTRDFSKADNKIWVAMITLLHPREVMCKMTHIPTQSRGSPTTIIVGHMGMMCPLLTSLPRALSHTNITYGTPQSKTRATALRRTHIKIHGHNQNLVTTDM
jgi:hypothetical protein